MNIMVGCRHFDGILRYMYIFVFSSQECFVITCFFFDSSTPGQQIHSDLKKKKKALATYHDNGEASQLHKLHWCAIATIMTKH